MSAPANKRFKPADGVLSQDVNGELVLLHLDGETYYGLNEVGARAWQLLGNGVSETELVDALLGEYEVSAQRLRADVRALLDELLEKRLVTAAPVA